MLHPSPQPRGHAPAAPGPREAGQSALLSAAAREFAEIAARTSHPVLLQGETGVGKTHLARLIHEMGARREKPFVAVNCGAIPRELFEREMFGHVRGAFTGATGAAAGLFEAASGGTLFLDEVGELPPESQPKLLRALEEGAIRRLGATTQTRVDVRIIAASNRVLLELARDRSFRQDLYYRLCVVEHEILPLRRRRWEIPALTRFLLQQSAEGGACISDDAIERICAYPWPGNIRELNNALCHALVRSGGGCVELRHLPDRVRAPGLGHGWEAGEELRRGRYAAPEDPGEERDRISQALRAEGGNRTRTAERLGMSRSTLWAKLRFHHLV